MKRVIVVDDCEADRYLIRRTIERRHTGVDFVECPDAPSALRYFEQAAWFTQRNYSEYKGDSGEAQGTVLLVDINMPRMNGFQFLDQLQNLMKERQVPANALWIAVLSSSRARQDRARAAGMLVVDECLAKPIELADLDRLVPPSNSGLSA